MSALAEWGWDEAWGEAWALHGGSGREPGRVVRGDREAYEVRLADGVRPAEATGRLRQAGSPALPPPATYQR